MPSCVKNFTRKESNQSREIEINSLTYAFVFQLSVRISHYGSSQPNLFDPASQYCIRMICCCWERKIGVFINKTIPKVKKNNTQAKTRNRILVHMVQYGTLLQHTLPTQAPGSIHFYYNNLPRSNYDCDQCYFDHRYPTTHYDCYYYQFPWPWEHYCGRWWWRSRVERRCYRRYCHRLYSWLYPSLSPNLDLRQLLRRTPNQWEGCIYAW